LAKKTFNDIFLEAVDDALSSLGNSAKQSIYFHLEDKFGIEKENIASNVKEFECGLHKIFGVGAKYIEILIMKSLHERLHRPLEWKENKELVFVDYVNAAKQSYVRAVSKRSIRATRA
jgi:hypothetical protein